MKRIEHQLAEANHEEQAAFLNEMARMLIMLCKEKYKMQCCYIADALDRNGEELVDQLWGFVELKRKRDPAK